MTAIAKRINNFSQQNRRYAILLLQVFLVMSGYVLAFCLRFDFRIPPVYTSAMLKTLPYLLLCRMAVYYYYRLNSEWWRFVSMVDLMNITKAVAIGTLLLLVGLVFGYGLTGFPRTVIVIEAVLNFMLLGGVRFAVRWFRETLVRKQPKQFTHSLIVGAGKSGIQLLNEIRINPQLGIRVLGFVDDDPRKKHAYIQGVQVLGNTSEIPGLIKKYNVDEVIVAIPSAGFQKIAGIVRTIKECATGVKVLPGLLALIQKDGLWNQLRDVPCDELLDRPIIKFRRETDLLTLRTEIARKAVLITGAAGSIGGELSRQAARFEPQELILYDRDENGLYFIELELKEHFPECKITPVIGDLLDRRKFNEIVGRHKVDLIYHAAAYKHVPMMQREPREAVRNNIFATKIVIETCLANNVKKCVYISTDKAVSPSSVMGATKRVGEMILQGSSGHSTDFVTVRFGNVIGSSGSVMQLFKRQIVQGGPVTVTHPGATRYFMAISEAVQLVMTAGVIGKSGEIFLLDMGKPVKIIDMARRLIESSGLTPEKDIEIKFIGLRPGEKLEEELFWKGEDVVQTENKKIMMLKSNGFNKNILFLQLNRLEAFLAQQNDCELLKTLSAMVPEAAFLTNGKNGNGSVKPASLSLKTSGKAVVENA